MKIKAPLFTLIILTSFTFTSCKKEDTTPQNTSETTDPDPECDTIYTDIHLNDTIFSSPYLMSYPGSEWNYDDGTTTTCDSWESVGIAVRTNSSGCPLVTRTFHVLPKMNNGYTMFDASVNTSNPINSVVHQSLDTLVGQFEEYHNHYGEMPPFYGGSRNYTLEVAELLPSFTVLGTTYYDVIHVHETLDQYDNDMGSSQWTSEFYYARNVGLIRYQSNYPGGNSTKNLTSYSIGPH